MDITEKIWWIAKKGKSEGPFSYLELERDEKLDSDTFVWKEGWDTWQKAKESEEFKQLFKKEEPIEEDLGQSGVESIVHDEEAATSGTIPPWIFFGIIAIILSIAYLWQLLRT